MNSTTLTALAAVFGSLLGAAASILANWINQRHESLRANKVWVLRERDALYKEFITEASRLTIDALTHSMEKPDRMMKLYGLLSCIRLMSCEEVVRQGEDCCRRIIELYGQPNLTTDQIRAAVAAYQIDKLDALKDFSAACRQELLAGQG